MAFVLRMSFAIAALAVASVLGESYISRLPDHRGLYLVEVSDRVDPPIAQRPRHTIVVVIDGLRADFAARMRSTAIIKQQGACFDTGVGPISVSRPVYAVISTGLEQDRTGARNNDEESPLAAHSIWESARESGFVVNGTADVPWWQQLFPNGFTHLAKLQEADNFFAVTEPADLTLIHPGYVDHAGHDYGAASSEYAKAVDRVDGELEQFLTRLDLSRDLVILTADHGHSATGGHGGTDPEIATVLTCFGGFGVKRSPQTQPSMTRAIGPAIALLIGVPFPRHMRAGEDELDGVLALADEQALGVEYLRGRRAAVERFRAENRVALAHWLEYPGTWGDLYRYRAKIQHARGTLFLAIGLIALLIRRRTPILWIAASLAGLVALYVTIRGGFDFTSINQRSEFIPVGLAICAAAAIASIAAHALIFRSGHRLAADSLALTAVVLWINLAHVVAYGWPLGFPLPGPEVLFTPFLAAMYLAACAVLAALINLRHRGMR